MARAVELSGAYAVLTSDNPRTENPELILDDAMAGFEDADKVTRIKDRAQAIDYAIQNAQQGDIVIVAGKGHEDYIDVNNKKVPWSEFKAIDSSLSKRRGRQ
jgi:UDP-N-acetylmuramoyl-L-alanyl-D-glutamate--2,6-diaminopimelate ligase